MNSTFKSPHRSGGVADGNEDDLYDEASVFSPDRTTVDRPDSGYLWCRVCERVFRYGQYCQDGGKQMCPFDDCGGDLAGALPWEVRKDHHPAFPKYPIEGSRYKRGC